MLGVSQHTPNKRKQDTMNTNRSAAIRNTIIVAVIAGASVLGLAVPAHALSTDNVVGYPGHVSVNPPMISTTEFSQVITYSPYIAVPTPVFSTNGMTAYRSSARAGTQYIQAQYQLQKYDYNARSWVNWQTTNWMTATVAATTTSTRFAAWSTMPRHSAGLYRMAYLVVWYDAAWNAFGMQRVFPSVYGESTCNTRLLGCTPYAYGVVVK